jgi:hypothetical protein
LRAAARIERPEAELLTGRQWGSLAFVVSNFYMTTIRFSRHGLIARSLPFGPDTKTF